MNQQTTFQDLLHSAADHLLKSVSALPTCRRIEIRAMLLSTPLLPLYEDYLVQTYPMGIAQGRIMWLVESTALISTDLAAAQAAALAESAKMRPVLTRLGWRKRSPA